MEEVSLVPVSRLSLSFPSCGSYACKIHLRSVYWQIYFALTEALYARACQYRSGMPIFIFFSCSSSSVMLVTQDHSYSISATRGHEILNYIMKYHTYNTIWQSVRTPCNCRYLHPALEVLPFTWYLLGWKSGVQTVEFVYLLTNEVLGLEFMIIVDHLSPVYWKNPTLMCLMWCLESLSMARSISIIPFSSLMVPEYSFSVIA